jgi:hypothetical protein
VLPSTPKARETAAIAGAVKLIRSAVGTEDDQIAEYGAEFATAWMVRSTVNAMQDWLAISDDKSPFGNRTRNRNLLIEMLEHIRALQDILREMPSGVKGLIFSTDESAGTGFVRAGHFVCVAEKSERAIPRLYNFAVTLQSLKNRCATFTESLPGEHPTIDFPSKLAAICAADILEYHGVKPTRGNDAKASTFEQLAAFLYEAATGDDSKELAHACRKEIDRRNAQK